MRNERKCSIFICHFLCLYFDEETATVTGDKVNVIIEWIATWSYARGTSHT